MGMDQSLQWNREEGESQILCQLLVKDLIKIKTPSLTSSNNFQYYIAFCTTNNATNVPFLKHRMWNDKELTC
jgi:hypothetical protein